MTISEEMSNGRRGQMATTGGTFRTKLAAAAQPAGVMVAPSATSNDHGKVPATAADVAKAYGVAVYMPSLPMADGVNEYAQDDEMTICQTGQPFVVTEEAVSPADDVYCRFAAAGANTQLGAFRTDADATEVDAILKLTETDANVEDGTFVVTLLDSDTGATYQASFTSSTTSHANAATGIAAAIDAVAPTTSTPGAEAANAIDITIVHATSGAVVEIVNVESVGASALSVDTQGSVGATCALVPNAAFEETTTGSGVAKLSIARPQ